ncbi:MAG: hypothetical protein ACOY3M_01195 [Patescibacteria group bacterium]
MDDKLRAVVTRVELSKLTESEKEDVYTALAEGLQSTVWPILIKYMPKDQLDDLAANPTKVNLETYGKLIEDSVKDGQALKEIEALMQDILTAVDKTLTEQGVPELPSTG